MFDSKNQFDQLLKTGAAPKKVDESSLRDPGDYEAMRREIFNKAEQAVKKMSSPSNKTYTLEIGDVGWKKDPEYGPEDTLKAVKEGESLTRQLTGRFNLIDNESGKVVDQSGRKTLMNVPYFTDDGSFIIDGTEMSFTKQARLNPGVYTHKRKDGTPQSQVVAGQAGGFRMLMEPETGVFHFRMGSRHIPAYHVLKEMGVSDDILKKRWGKLYDANKKQGLSSSARKWIEEKADQGWRSIQRGRSPRDESLSDNANGLRAWFSQRTLDPETTDATLNMRADRITPEVLLRTTQNLQKVHSGEKEPDNRDSLKFQEIWDFPDRLAESIQRDKTGQMRKTLWDVTRKKSVDSVPSSPLDSYVQDLFVNSGNQQVLEQTNPLDMYHNATKLTWLGEGGIPSTDQAPMSAKAVQPSYAGYVDLFRSPECYAEDMEVMTEEGWKKWPDVTYEDKFACLIDNRLEYHHPEALQQYYVDEELYGAETKMISYLVTGNHRMWIRPVDGNKEYDTFLDYRFEYAKDIHNEKKRTVINGGMGSVQKENPFTEFYLATTDYFKQHYKGYVYCATVPGGLLYVRRNNKSGFWCGNSARVGLDMFLADGAKIGPDRKLYRKLHNTKTGKPENVDMQTAAKSTVAFPSFYKQDEDKKYVYGLKGDDETIVPREEVDYVLPEGDNLASALGRVPPLSGGTKGMRRLLGSKFLRHAVATEDGETPYVQTRSETGRPMAAELGKYAGARFAPESGTVTKVGKNRIHIQDAQGNEHQVPMHYQRPYLQKTGLHNTPLVKAGDPVEKGQTVAKSEYTDDQGNLAVTKNLRAAYLPGRGNTIEDSHLISESAAEKLKPELMMSPGFELDDEHELSKKKFMQKFPGRYTPEQLAKIDEDGGPKPGAQLEYGDPVYLAVHNRPASESTLNRPLQTDASQTWDYKKPGKVVRKYPTESGVTSDIRTQFKAEPGSKLGIPFGGKGVVGKVEPDETMFRDSQGRPIDIALNPLSIGSRVNPSQLAAAALGKVAEQTGKKYTLPGTFEDPDGEGA